jgi:hypothetical protein
MVQKDEKNINTSDENDIEDFDDFEEYYKINSKDIDDNSETGLKELDFN